MIRLFRIVELFIAAFLCVVVSLPVHAQRGQVQRRVVYRNSKNTPMVPCGIQNQSPECVAHDDSLKQKALREDYEMIVAQTADCLRDMSRHKGNMGRDALLTYPAYGEQLAKATQVAIMQRNTCAEWVNAQPDTTKNPPPVLPKPEVGPHSQKRIPVKKP